MSSQVVEYLVQAPALEVQTASVEFGGIIAEMAMSVNTAYTYAPTQTRDALLGAMRGV